MDMRLLNLTRKERNASLSKKFCCLPFTQQINKGENLMIQGIRKLHPWWKQELLCLPENVGLENALRLVRCSLN